MMSSPIHLLINAKGKDDLGIVARALSAISGLLVETQIDIVDLSFSLKNESFRVAMIVDVSGAVASIAEFSGSLGTLGGILGLQIDVESDYNFVPRAVEI